MAWTLYTISWSKTLTLNRLRFLDQLSFDRSYAPDGKTCRALALIANRENRKRNRATVSFTISTSGRISAIGSQRQTRTLATFLNTLTFAMLHELLL